MPGMTAELILLRERDWQSVSGTPGQETGDFIARELSALGIETERRITVEADMLAVQHALADALERSDVIVVLGGLGVGGVTLRAVAGGLDIPLEEHRESLLHVSEYYAYRDEQPPEGWQEQAQLPKGAAVFRNGRGSAPGCAISAGSQCILMLPGEARELYPMTAEYVYPYLAEFCGEGVSCRTLRAFGLEGTVAAEVLGELLESEDPVVSVYPHSGELLVRVTALAHEGAEPASARCQMMVNRIRERLGWQVYGADTDTLPQTAVRALRHHKLHAATAEFGTGGELGMLLSDAPGSGIVSAQPLLVRDSVEFLRLTGVEAEEDEPPESVLWRAAAALAQRACALVGAEVGLAVVTERGEDGVMLEACAALCVDGQVWTRMMPAVSGPESAERTAHIAALHALDQLRLYLDGPPDAMPDGEAVGPLPPVAPPVEKPVKRRARKTGGKADVKSENAKKRNPVLAFLWPSKGDTGGEIARKIIMLAAALVLLGALGYLGWSYAQGPEDAVQVSAESSELPSEPESEVSAPPVSSEENSTSSSEESSSVSEESSSEEPSSASSEKSSLSSSVSSSSQSSVSSSSVSSSSQSSVSSSSVSSSSTVESTSSSTAPSSTSSEPIVISMGSSSAKESSTEHAEESSRESSSKEEDFIAGKEVKGESSSREDSSSDDEGADNSGGPIAMDETVTINGEDMSAYDAICKITMNETGGTMRKEAIKAQAVAAYSRLVARGGTLSGMGLRTPNSTVKNAVSSVWGETVRSGGRTIDVFFGASTNGMTNTAKEVWGGSMAGHTENVESPWDTSAPGYEFTKKMSRDDVISRVYDAFGIDLTDVPDDEWFYVDSYTGANYNNKMTVGGTKKTTGRYLRENVLNLRSACFEWEFNGDYVLFTTYGYGHGAGMSQQGANGMAGEGSNYVEILEHYYAGCTVG